MAPPREQGFAQAPSFAEAIESEQQTQNSGQLNWAVTVRDYWIINVISSRLEVYRDPIADPSQPFGHGFGSCTTYLLESEVAPLFAPDRPVAVKSLF